MNIPNLKSRHIPVYSSSYSLTNDIQFWEKNDTFIYPNILLNLLTISSKDIVNLNFPANMFLLTDSGGFQVISGTCNIDWKESLKLQIELKASKIFAFDTPPVKRKTEGINDFLYMNDKETKQQIKENFEVALKQSLYLKEHYPEERKKFCYILHGANKEQWDYNLQLIKERLGGSEGYDKCFPGGIVYAIKSNDILTLAFAAIHAKKYFISRGKYVHFLGCGSYNKMFILIRNQITTFDSSTALQGAKVNVYTNPCNIFKSISIPTNNIPFETQFCSCPVCSKINYHKLAKENSSLIGRYFVLHNLWHMLKMNIFLDSLKISNYTQIIKEQFKPSASVMQALEFCDYADKVGFEIAYEKYKHYLKKDETKQKTIF